MKRAAFLLVPAVLWSAAGCHHQTEADRAASDAAAIATVEAAQNVIPPPTPVVPEPVSFAALNTPGTAVTLPPDVPRPGPADGCRFVTAGAAPDHAAFVGAAKIGLMRQLGQDQLFAADSGSAFLSDQLHAKYTSATYQITLTRGDALVGDSGTAASPRRAWGGAMQVRDRYDRVVYFSAGEIRC